MLQKYKEYQFKEFYPLKRIGTLMERIKAG
jgi:hypothetical protein